jgi:hypothetical protein
MCKDPAAVVVDGERDGFTDLVADCVVYVPSLEEARCIGRELQTGADLMYLSVFMDGG